jgi:segregation and condensation protein B
MEIEKIKPIVEAILFTTHNPVLIDEIKNVVNEAKASEIKKAVERLQEEHNGGSGGICIKAVAGGFQMCTKPELSGWIKKFHQVERKEKLSRAALETLAIIAYKQPVVRPEIEAIRGVGVDYIIKRLLENELIRVMGRKKTVGAPLIYGTTEKFLSYFGLSSLSELPKFEEFGLAGAGGEEESSGKGEADEN